MSELTYSPKEGEKIILDPVDGKALAFLQVHGSHPDNDTPQVAEIILGPEDLIRLAAMFQAESGILEVRQMVLEEEAREDELRKRW